MERTYKAKDVVRWAVEKYDSQCEEWDNECELAQEALEAEWKSRPDNPNRKRQEFARYAYRLEVVMNPSGELEIPESDPVYQILKSLGKSSLDSYEKEALDITLNKLRDRTMERRDYEEILAGDDYLVDIRDNCGMLKEINLGAKIQSLNTEKEEGVQYQKIRKQTLHKRDLAYYGKRINGLDEDILGAKTQHRHFSLEEKTSLVENYPGLVSKFLNKLKGDRD